MRKVEIARRIEETMGSRQKSEKGESADIAAAVVDMSGEQYRRAKIVVDQGDMARRRNWTPGSTIIPY